jgi:anti-sigma factor RsiW
MAPSGYCPHAELAISRDLDGRLPRRERRRLRAHLQDCNGCADFARFQREQRTVLRSLRLVTIPVSLQVFRLTGF